MGQPERTIQPSRAVGRAGAIALGILAFATLGLPACAAPPVHVSVPEGAGLAGLSTFAVTGGEGVLGTGDDRMRRTVAEALAARGYRPAPEAVADLWVRWHGEMRARAYVDEGPLSPLLGARRPLEVHTTRTGRLSIALTARATARVVWEGAVNDVIDDPGRHRATVERAVRRILAALPRGPDPPGRN